MLSRKSGLLGVSGVSSDMREILEAVKGGQERAKLAFDIYIHRLRGGIGAMVAVLGGIDALVFTAGGCWRRSGRRGKPCLRRKSDCHADNRQLLKSGDRKSVV